jgi:Flp pilus assembly pilin Flp
MPKKITSLPLVLYVTFTEFVRKFKKDERGLSGVVVAILLILVAVLAILLIWGFLGDWLEELWNNITNQGNRIT